jgi:superfamily I DNA and/or RNA helicase
MFSTSNNIAYNGLMVQNTPLGTSDIGNHLGESVWIDIEGGGQVAGKWSQSEGDAASQLLIRLLDAGVAAPDIFFITPFRIVAQNLRKMFTQNPAISRRLPANPLAWVNDRVGTVHTFQGKQAEAVVLVLGAPLDQSAGARTWAAHPPNLLNVAVSRAKHRLYVIGSHQAWSNVGVFRTLARNLPRTGTISH